MGIESLDVAEIVGPPYAVLALEPTLGPLTGDRELVVNGINFPDGKAQRDLAVRGTDPLDPRDATPTPLVPPCRRPHLCCVTVRSRLNSPTGSTRRW